MQEQCQCFGVGLGVCAVAEMLSRAWCGAVDWDKPKTVSSAVTAENRFLFECDADILVAKQVHAFGCEDGGAVGVTGLANG